MYRNVVRVTVFAAIITFSLAAFGEDTPGTKLILSIKVSEKAPDADRLKILAEPTIATTVGRAFSYVSGRSVKPRTGDDRLETGTRVTGTLEPAGNGALQLALKIQIGAAVSQEDDPSTDLVRTETIDLRTIIRPGKTKRFNCSAYQRCEISVDAVDGDCDEQNNTRERPASSVSNGRSITAAP